MFIRRLNHHYWKLRGDIQGLKSPVPVTEDTLDALGKYHVAAFVPYIRFRFL